MAGTDTLKLSCGEARGILATCFINKEFVPPQIGTQKYAACVHYAGCEECRKKGLSEIVAGYEWVKALSDIVEELHAYIFGPRDGNT